MLTTVTGVKIANLYSGHGTYSTLGLAHTDKRIREHMLSNWLIPMAETAGKLGAGMGFFCHAFSESVLQDPELYHEAEETLYENLAKLSTAALKSGCADLCLEQMYTPHQLPWTIASAGKLLSRVSSISQNPFYLSLDTGHQSGQRKFIAPGYGRLKELIRLYKSGQRISNLWLGTKKAYTLFNRAVSAPIENEDSMIRSILYEIEASPHLFAKYEDGDTYVWLEKMSGYSPIIHLQQTDGFVSAHYPFTPEYNRNGIISGRQVLNAIQASYVEKEWACMPPKCEKLYLTLEIFSGTAEINIDILHKIKQSVDYWRRFIPVDGMSLSECIAAIQEGIA